jgi:hypothetical protein
MNKTLDKDTKILLLKIIQKGEITEDDFKELREKLGFETIIVEVIDKTNPK